MFWGHKGPDEITLLKCLQHAIFGQRSEKIITTGKKLHNGVAKLTLECQFESEASDQAAVFEELRERTCFNT